MSLQLGLIVLPSNTEELNKVLAALAPLGVASSAITTSTKTAPKAKAAEPEVETEALPAVTADQVKTAMTRVRDELGEETISELLTAFGATKLKDVAKDDWAALVAAANVALDGGSTDSPDDDFGLDDEGDDGFGLDDDEAPDAETVKLTVQAYAKKHGKEKAQAILVKFGLNTVRGLASADAATLTKIQAAASKL